MSDVPPPPGYSSPPPPPNYSPPPPPLPGTPPPPGTSAPTGKAKRANVAVGGWLLIVGGALVAIGTFLPWVSRSGVSLNGFDDFVYVGDGEIQVFEGPGVMSLLGGAIGLGLGIALVVAGRVLAVAIVATVFASIGILFGIFLVMIANDTADFADASLGIGAILQPIGPLVATVGAIITLAKRR